MQKLAVGLIVLWISLFIVARTLNNHYYYSEKVVDKYWYVERQTLEFQDYVYCSNRILKMADGLTRCFNSRGFQIISSSVTMGDTESLPPYFYNNEFRGGCYEYYYPEVGCKSVRDYTRFVIILESGTECLVYRNLWERSEINDRLWFNKARNAIICESLRRK